MEKVITHIFAHRFRSEIFELAAEAQSFDLYERIFKTNDLVEGDSAQWAAGLLYAYTQQETDARDYLVECSTQIDRLDIKLQRAYSKYGAESYTSGNKEIRNTEPYFRSSMADCAETNDAFEEMADRAHTFFDTDGWRDVATANYEKNKAVIDQQWAYGLTSWDQGVFFNAGMFYGRVWYYMAYGQPI